MFQTTSNFLYGTMQQGALTVKKIQIPSSPAIVEIYCHTFKHIIEESRCFS